LTTYRTIQLVLLGLLIVAFGLATLARRFPETGWLQLFRFNPPQLSDEEKVRLRRRSNIHAGIELLLLGIVLPLIYIAITVMLFNTFDTVMNVLVFAASVLCIGLGLTAIWKNR
jgi:hypothetical protein